MGRKFATAPNTPPTATPVLPTRSRPTPVLTLAMGRPPVLTPAVTMHLHQLQLKPTSQQTTTELRQPQLVTTGPLQHQTTDINDWCHSGRRRRRRKTDDLIPSLAGDIQSATPTTGLLARARLEESCCGLPGGVVSVSSFTGGLRCDIYFNGFQRTNIVRGWQSSSGASTISV